MITASAETKSDPSYELIKTSLLAFSPQLFHPRLKQLPFIKS